MKILQGTTPTLILVMKDSDGNEVDLSEVELAYTRLIITQPSRLVPLVQTTDVTVDGNEVSYTFTEKQTLAMKPKEPLIYQVRFVCVDGTIFGTSSGTVEVEKLWEITQIGGIDGQDS